MTPPQTLVLPEQGDWQLRVVPNLYPALDRQEVVVQSRRHIRSVAEAEDRELELVAEAWQRRAAAERGDVFALLNEGRGAGASLAHSHSQLAWLSEPAPRRAAPRAVTVEERTGLVVSCPWASRVPYETVIAPAAGDTDPFESELLAPALKLLADLVRRLQRLEGQIPLNVWLERGESDWRLVLFPRLNVLAGLELGAGLFVNTLAPEEAAQRLGEESAG
jgi:UDPglucose--hexose-1-phosphate uridylyltransferase